MENTDIQTIIKILDHKKRNDLSVLLRNCLSEIEQSLTFGSVWNSVISSFLIYAPVEDYFKLKKLSEDNQGVVLDSIKDIYPITENAPEIISIEFRILREGEYKNQELSSYIGRTVRVFLSYSTAMKEDRELAGNLKIQLEELGLEVFLAHEDINPSSEWQEVILENLNSTDIFMPIIGDKFHSSFWTDQESGIALAKEKFILPIAIDKNVPYGFLGKIQAFRHNSQLPINACKIIESVVQNNPKFSSPLLDSLIKSFANSYSYDNAGDKASLLLKFNRMTAEQINEIFRSILQNGQINESMLAFRSIKELFKKHKDSLDEKLLERVLNHKRLKILKELD